MEAIEDLSITAMSMECCVSNDNMWHWRVEFETSISSSWVIFEGIMVIIGDKGVMTILEVVNSCAML